MKHTWFRLYTEVLDDPKVGQLSDGAFRTWVHLMCLVKRQPVGTFRALSGHGSVIAGVLPRQKAVIYALRIDHKKWARHRDALISAGLLDIVEVDGKQELALHGWAGRQFISDDSSERVRRFRNAQCNVTETVTVTPPEYRVQSTPLTPLAGGDCDAPFSPPLEALIERWPRNRRATPDQVARALVGLPTFAADPKRTWDRIETAASNYLATDEARRGIVQRLDRWIAGGTWLHHEATDAGGQTPLITVDQYERWLEEDAQ